MAPVALVYTIGQNLKNSSFEEYRKSCLYRDIDETGKMELCSSEKGNCSDTCPRMKNKKKLHNNSNNI